MIVGWKAWFVDVPKQKGLLHYTSDVCPFEKLPGDGCLGFVFYHDIPKPDGNPRRSIYKSQDYYFKSGKIYGNNLDVRDRDVQAEIRARCDSPRIIRGIWTDDDTIELLDKEMREAVTWP